MMIMLIIWSWDKPSSAGGGGGVLWAVKRGCTGRVVSSASKSRVYALGSPLKWARNFDIWRLFSAPQASQPSFKGASECLPIPAALLGFQEKLASRREWQNVETILFVCPLAGVGWLVGTLLEHK